MERILNEFISKAQSQQHVINGVKIVSGEQTLASYNRLPDKERLHTFSASKSVTSIGVGIAIDEGLISLDETIAESFTEYLDEQVDPAVYQITVRHLLMMTCGLKEPLFFYATPERYAIKDWITHFFQADFSHEPGTHFLYSNFNAYMLGCLIEKKTGENLAKYLETRLFNKLGIESPDWLTCPMGHTTAANGLFLTIDELSQFGEMLLQRGGYQGQRIVSAEYVAEATRNQFTKDWPKQGYGYQFWRGNDGLSYYASGKYGQLIHVLEAENMVISIQALDEKDSESFVWNELIQPIKKLSNE